jgi:hypothetical protein
MFKRKKGLRIMDTAKRRERDNRLVQLFRQG